MKICFAILFSCICPSLIAQPVYKDAIKSNRDKLYRNLVNNTITKNLSRALSDSTEEYWQDAFGAIGLIHYTSPWIAGRLKIAVNNMNLQSIDFQQSLLQLIYSNFPDEHYQPVKLMLMRTDDPKVFSMSALYIMNSSHGKEDINFLAIKTKHQLAKYPGNPILAELSRTINNFETPMSIPDLKPFFMKTYLPKNVLLFSFQRKNRDFPGLVIVRDTLGNLLVDSNGIYFHIPQLARAASNLPGFLSNGNTPEGVFRMEGFDKSKAGFIGPTTNIQLTMPFEYNARQFFQDSTLTDSSWDLANYQKLLPVSFVSYAPVFQSYYAGKAGRTAIIAHGTTIDPAYYLSTTYYPLTPTQGCLCTKETWDTETGMRLESDQQKLIDAVKTAGGAHGYVIVINIDDQQKAVSLDDISPFLPQ